MLFVKFKICCFEKESERFLIYFDKQPDVVEGGVEAVKGGKEAGGEIKRDPETPEELLIALIELDRKYESAKEAVNDTSDDIHEVLAQFKMKAAKFKEQYKDDPEILDLLETIEEAIANLEKDLADITREFKIEKLRMAKRLSSMPELFRRFGLVFENKQITYDDLNQFIESQTGESFYANWQRLGYPGASNEQEFKASFDRCVSGLFIGDYSRELALADAFAEEGGFNRNPDGSLSTKAYAGMNMPHSVVLEMFNQLFSGVKFDTNGNPHGTGVLKIDLGAEENSVVVKVDFDSKTITPPLRIKDQLGNEAEITFEHLMAFVNIYLSKDLNGESLFLRNGDVFSVNLTRTNPSAMNVFMNTAKTEVFFHETMHAFYDGNSEYKRAILDRVKSSTQEQRECAVMFAACNYDVFDPDVERVSKDLVIDEAYNAYSNESRYDIAGMKSMEFNVGRFCEKYNIKLSLDDYNSLAELNIKREYVEFGTGMTEEEEGSLRRNESEFIHKYPEKILKGCFDFKLLRELVAKQHPDFFKRIQDVRAKLVDWVDAA